MHVTERRQLISGLGLILLGIGVAVVASFFAHMAEADDVNEFGQEIYAGFPRGWIPATISQVVALGGAIMAIAGIAVAFVYKRTLTWARAMTGAVLFVGLMVILFGVIPNQLLTLFQATLEWTPQKIFLTVPSVLVLGNDVSISYAALKDMLVAGYVTTMLFAVPIVMYQWQERAKKGDQAKPEPVSSYGRPLRTPAGHSPNGHGNGQVIG